MNEPEDPDDWQLWWDARMAALEGVLGPSDDKVRHAMIPFQMGPELGGAADVVYFSGHVDGVVAVTSELIGCDDQTPNNQGNYELMMCGRDDVDWGAGLISQLAHYTLECPLNAGDTMDVGPAVPVGSTIAALLFCDYARFRVRDLEAGLLLCVGITADELEACRSGRTDEVLDGLKTTGVSPFTDLYRDSVLG